MEHNEIISFTEIFGFWLFVLISKRQKPLWTRLTMIYLFQVIAIILFLFILGGRRGIVNLGCIQKFFTGAKKESLLGSKLHPSLLFTETDTKTQLIFNCSTEETLEKGVKFFKINFKKTRTTSLTSFWCFYC